MQIGKISEKEVLELARKGYEQGDVDFEIKPEKTALLVIDMQDEFVKPNWSPYWVPEATKIVPKIKRMIKHCRQENIPIIYTVYSETNKFLDRPKTFFKLPRCLPDLDFDQSEFFKKGKVWHEIEPEKDDIIIHKTSYGAFFETPLETILKNLKKDTVIICGTITNNCCSTTARQAYERSFKVIFGSDINAAHFKDLHEAELKVLRRGFAKIKKLDEIIEILDI